MKKIRYSGLGILLIGIPLLVYGWCCLPPTKHCSNQYKLDEMGKVVFVDEKGVPAQKDSKGMCAKCHHEVEVHTCNEDGWPDLK